VLVPKDQPDAIALAVEDLLDHPDFAADMGASGRRVVAEKFGIAAAARQTAAVYEAAMSGQTPSTSGLETGAEPPPSQD